eukprot:7346653-Prymnesium_polylepis.1
MCGRVLPECASGGRGQMTGGVHRQRAARSTPLSRWSCVQARVVHRQRAAESVPLSRSLVVQAAGAAKAGGREAAGALRTR